MECKTKTIKRSIDMSIRRWNSRTIILTKQNYQQLQKRIKLQRRRQPIRKFDNILNSSYKIRSQKLRYCKKKKNNFIETSSSLRPKLPDINQYYFSESI